MEVATTNGSIDIYWLLIYYCQCLQGPIDQKDNGGHNFRLQTYPPVPHESQDLVSDLTYYSHKYGRYPDKLRRYQ